MQKMSDFTKIVEPVQSCWAMTTMPHHAPPCPTTTTAAAHHNGTQRKQLTLLTMFSGQLSTMDPLPPRLRIRKTIWLAPTPSPSYFPNHHFRHCHWPRVLLLSAGVMELGICLRQCGAIGISLWELQLWWTHVFGCKWGKVEESGGKWRTFTFANGPPRPRPPLSALRSSAKANQWAKLAFATAQLNKVKRPLQL